MKVMFLLLLMCPNLLGAEDPQSKERNAPEDKLKQKLYGTIYANRFFNPLLQGSVVHEFASKTKIPARSAQCYNQLCGNGSDLIVGFQMAQSGGVANKGLLSSYVSHANGTRIYTTPKPKSEDNFKMECTERGWFEFCLDNSGDRYFEKTASFHVIVIHKQLFKLFHHTMQNSSNSNSFNAVYAVYDKMYQITQNWLFVKVFLHKKDGHHRQDYNTLISNAYRVNTTAVITVVVSLIVGFVQVVLVRRMFDDKRGISNKSTSRL